MDPSASASASPSAGSAGSLDAALAGLAGATLALTFLVLCAGLYFAWRYHQEVLKVFASALAQGHSSVQGTDVAAMSGRPGATISGVSASKVVGPASVAVGQSAKYTVDPSVGDQVEWTAEGALSTSFKGQEFVCQFTKQGSQTVTAAAEGKTIAPLKVDVTSGAASKGIVLPFAIGNWGRFVVTTLGVGVIGTLMLAKVLDSAAGIGVLGTLLGVGVATAQPGAQQDTAVISAGDGEAKK